LVKVYLLDGKEQWVLIHIEVQGQRDDDFPERMFISYYRIFDRYKKRIAGFAILSDNDPNWHPHVGLRVAHPTGEAGGRIGPPEAWPWDGRQQ
jgi:hypothetical protein